MGLGHACYDKRAMPQLSNWRGSIANFEYVIPEIGASNRGRVHLHKWST